MSQPENIILLDQSIEDRYLRSLVGYEKLISLTYEDIKYENFSNASKGRLLTLIVDIWKKDKIAPTFDILEATINSSYKSTDSQTIDLRTLQVIKSIPLPDWRWLVRNIDNYIRKIKLHKALYDCSHLLKNDEVEEAHEKLALLIKSPGINSKKTDNVLNLSKREVQEIIEAKDDFCSKTGISALDTCIGGIYKDQLMVILAPLNTGKSWAMVHLTKQALISGKYVLYVTLEMSRKQVLLRLFQSIASATKEGSDKALTRDVELWNRLYTSRDRITQRPTLSNINQIYEKYKSMKSFAGSLYVEEFSSGQCAVQDIERAIVLYDVNFDRLPDLVLVDGLMDIKQNIRGSQLRTELTSSVANLRGMAQRYNTAVVVTHQANREGIIKKSVGIEHTGESIGIMQVADIALGLSQTKQEAVLGEMRISVLRSRHTGKNYNIVMKQAMDVGQFCLFSEMQRKEVFDSDDDEDE